MQKTDLVHFSREQIRAGSKSFSFASFFFNERERQGAWLLYSWCRHCDDLIDEAPDQNAALEALAFLEHETRSVLGLLPSSPPATEPAPAFAGLRSVVREFDIPTAYPLDLLRGMRMDVEGRGFESFSELDEYCYCVAGVVGLMMCHITGISTPHALDHAVAFGSAMQLTNIARDVDHDWSMGRIYFPREWLRELFIDATEFGSPANRQKWPILTQRLLRIAEERYRTGEKGLSFLSFRSALAVAIAGRVYREIGLKVRAHGARAWDQRRYVRSSSKAWLALKTGGWLTWNFRTRLWQNWQANPIQKIYRHGSGQKDSVKNPIGEMQKKENKYPLRVERKDPSHPLHE